MSLPVPIPGLVLRYSYLWKRESDADREEGIKDRPCAVVMVVEDSEGRSNVFVLPITHSVPRAPAVGIEIPRPVKSRLGLDTERSWVIISEANVFAWPGPDLRPLPGKRLESISYGVLPPAFFRFLREAYLRLDNERKVSLVPRTE